MKLLTASKTIVIIAAFAISSCQTDRLNLYPLTQLSEGNFYNNVTELEQVVNNVYVQLGRLANSSSLADLYGELYSDNAECFFTNGDVNGAGDETIANYTIRTSNARILSAWNTTYNAIYLCNNILQQVENTDLDIDDSIKKRWISEVLVVRSLAYFNLVRVFGDVPLVLKRINPSEAHDYLRENTDVVYAQIIEDLLQAKSSLPDQSIGTEAGRLTSYAASALLAKVYLTRLDKASAKAELEYIINSGRFSLDANSDGKVDKEDFLFNFLPETKNSPESVLEAQYKSGVNAVNSSHQQAYAPYHIAFNLPNTSGSFRGLGVNVPTQDLMDEYEKGDPRRTIAIKDGFIDQTTGNFIALPYTFKFFDPNWTNPGQNFEIIRYADILLMYAEVTEDPKYLNLIRERVGLPPFGSPQYPSSLYPTLALAIEHERRMELSHEMHRTFDLKRTGRLIEVLASKGFPVSEKNLLFPIPESVIDVVPAIRQNDGY